VKRSCEDDERLIEGCIRKEIAAWSLFVKRYSSLISFSITNRLGKYGFKLPSQEIEDIRQNVFTSIWKGNKLSAVKNRRHVSYWLAVVAGNAAMEYMRTVRAAEAPAREISLDEKELQELIPSAAETPREACFRNDLQSNIIASINALPRKEKLVMKLHLLYGKRYHEIADILTLPRGTVSSYIKRAREKLRQSLKDFT
jgi:RNA polymerase sigma-70 factor (ECF subfamily)